MQLCWITGNTVNRIRLPIMKMDRRWLCTLPILVNFGVLLMATRFRVIAPDAR